MHPIHDFSAHIKKQTKDVLTDIDDPLTLEGRLPAIAYNSEALEETNPGPIEHSQQQAHHGQVSF
jgi:hypothetical protein